MTTLKAEKRNPETKTKKLRREGFTTGVLFGKDMDASISLQFSERDASRFIKDNKEGAQVILEIGSERTSAIVKNIDYDPMKRQILALDFQALVAGETISTSVPIKLLNESCIQGYVDQELSEIHYKAEPANLLEPIEINLEDLSSDIKTFYVKDLNLGAGSKVELITPEDALIFHVSEPSANEEEDAVESAETEATPADKEA